jgi:hypothetical protein
MVTLQVSMISQDRCHPYGSSKNQIWAGRSQNHALIHVRFGPGPLCG